MNTEQKQTESPSRLLGLVFSSSFSVLSSLEPCVQEALGKEAGRRHVTAAAGSPSRGCDVLGETGGERGTARAPTVRRATPPLRAGLRVDSRLPSSVTYPNLYVFIHLFTPCEKKNTTLLVIKLFF